MKNKVIPSDKQKHLNQGDFVVSKTDRSGKITYCNEIFIDLSGYSEKELLGKQHNIIRHPDMPRGVFELLWKTIKEGNECFAYVKNMSKDGSFYWVFANVTPDRDSQGNIIGYFSVRRKPSSNAISTISQLYTEMLTVEQNIGARDAKNASLDLLYSKLKEANMTYEEYVLSI